MSDRAFTRETYLATIQASVERHGEAASCASAGAWLAGLVMLGAALEGVLLVTAANAESDLRARDLWPKGDPLRWDLGVLIPLAITAGWFDAEVFGGPESGLADAVDGLRLFRNAIHPGAFVREGGSEVTFDEDLYRAAFETLEVVYAASLVVVEATDLEQHEGDRT